MDKKDENNNEYIQIYNPLSDDNNKLKQCLIKQIVNTSIYNSKQKNSPLECFEISRCFSYNSNKVYNEEIHLAGIMGNPQFSKKLWSEKDKELTWFQAKGLMEEFFEKLQAEISWIDPINFKCSKIYQSCYNFCHPYRTAILYDRLKKQEVGIFSQLNSTINQKICKSYNNYIFEIKIQNLINCINKNNHLDYNLKTYSIYPSVTRDISLILSKNHCAEFIQQKILKEMHPLIESVEIFNEYKQQYDCQNNRYVGFRMTYRSNTRTLNDQDIDIIDKKISDFLKHQL